VATIESTTLSNLNRGRTMYSFKANFIENIAPSEDIVQHWKIFRSNLEPDRYSTVCLRGSLNTMGVVCNNKNDVEKIANALKSGQSIDITSDSHRWSIGSGIALCVDIWFGSCGSGYGIKPAIGNQNWGGMGQVCNSPSQELELYFTYI